MGGITEIESDSFNESDSTSSFALLDVQDSARNSMLTGLFDKVAIPSHSSIGDEDLLSQLDRY